MIVRLRCSFLSFFEKRQQIRVDYIFLSRTHAVWKARINLQCRPFYNLRGKQTRRNALSQCSPPSFCAENYDRLVDSPFEIGTFREEDFEEGGARYRVVVDADPADYDMAHMVKTLRSIVRRRYAG